MFRAIVVSAVIAVALLRGGSLRGLAGIVLRYPGLAIGALLLQLLIFTPLRTTLNLDAHTTTLYILSMLALVLWAALNLHLSGVVPMTAGVVMNTAAIVANGGHMPLWPPAAAIAGTIDRFTEADGLHNNSALADDGVRLWLLTDILPLPAWVPFATVFSIGDVLLTLGVSMLIWRTMLPRRRPGRPAHPWSGGGAAPAAYPSDIGDDEWLLLLPYLAEAEGTRLGNTPRAVLNALRWLSRSGEQGLTLPDTFPPAPVVYEEAQPWAAGAFAAVAADLRALHAHLRRQRPAAPAAALRALLTELPIREADRPQVAELAAKVRAATGDPVEVLFTWQEGHGRSQHALYALPLPSGRRGFILLPQGWVEDPAFNWQPRLLRLAGEYEHLPSFVASVGTIRPGMRPGGGISLSEKGQP